MIRQMSNLPEAVIHVSPVVTHSLFSPFLAPGNAPANVRQSNGGSELVALVPVYVKTDHTGDHLGRVVPHAENSKKIAWTAYHNVLQPLLDLPENDLLQGFRCVGQDTVHFQDGSCIPGAFIYTCFFLFLGDLEEVWKILGVSGCPTCLISDGDLGDFAVTAPERSMADAKALVKEARLCIMQKRVEAPVTTAKDELKKWRLSAAHLKLWNPWFLVPHASYYCFPSDRLHAVYVTLECILQHEPSSLYLFV